MHDIGKPVVTKVTGSRITSHGHHRVGAEIAAAVLKRLDMPDDRRQRITWAVRHHMFHFFWNLTDPKQASPRHKAFVAGENFPLLLQLLNIDAKASLGGPTKDAAVEFYRKLRASVLTGGGDDH
jgi:poly(A) polymerase